MLHIKTLLLKKSEVILDARKLLKEQEKPKCLSPIVPSSEVQLCLPFKCGNMELSTKSPTGITADLNPEVEEQQQSGRWGSLSEQSGDMNADRQETPLLPPDGKLLSHSPHRVPPPLPRLLLSLLPFKVSERFREYICVCV